MSEKKLALILGATGGFGHEVASALLRRGWRIRAVNRNPETAAARCHFPAGSVEWRKGDALNEAEIIAAAEGASIIVHAANPPLYRNWPGLVMPMLRNTIEAARHSGARIVLPGSIYNFPVDGPHLLKEDTPQEAPSRKGKIRIEVETALREAQKDGVKSLVLRAGDFFGPNVTANSWISAVVKPGRPIPSIADPGRRGVGHAWAYLPDMAETVVQLIEQEDRLGLHEVFHFGGHWLEDDCEIIRAIQRAAGPSRVKIRRFPWWAVGLASPFVPLMRELWEMRYLWKVPFKLDNAKLTTFLGKEPHTPLEEAVRISLTGLGCLPKAD
ncbi:NAD(P)H-binding protein [Beijerinckia indica]|uniref:NAD-dependent epimerase/dehydratase n=1 Tax=Beijerinckia indica subsp. indica (strain ATCC 9039 / DSM 1715 / NCIMB 8712) TaxID=395963 RepID=B2IKQ6_BEII9|nr:NAD-dependent epimerase/dehydratase [Beijerinckia indica subsp. indica ATCC 9039]